jgi:demethylmenaquinone methyltransferase/2-methoxy-6-polyprenyl-1,4-benzoquinol methylase
MSNQGKRGVMMRMYLWAHVKFPHFVDCRPIFARQVIESSGFDIAEVRKLSMWGLPIEIVLGRTSH